MDGTEQIQSAEIDLQTVTNWRDEFPALKDI